MAISRFAASRVTQGLPKYQSAWDFDNVAQGAIEPIANHRFNGSTGNVVFSNLPQNYRDLYIVISGRGTNASVGDFWYMNPNQNSSSITSYNAVYTTGTGSATATSNRGNNTGNFELRDSMGGNATAGFVSAITGHILCYSDTNKFKTMLLRNCSERNGDGLNMLITTTFRDTAAITRLEFGSYNAALASGTTVTIYGIKAGV